MSAVLFLTGATVGDALGANARSFKGSFARLGYDFVEVNFARPDPMGELDRVIKEHTFEFVFSCAGMCMEIEAKTSAGEQTNVWDALGLPFLSLYGDTPAYFFDRHILPPGAFAALYAFQEHYEFRRRLPRVPNILGVLPPAVEDAFAKQTIDFNSKKRGKLLFLKNGNDPEQLLVRWRECLSETLFLMLTDLASELDNHLETDLSNDIDALVCAYFRDKGWDIESFTKLRIFFVAQLDDYCRRSKATLIVKSLLDLPIEVHGFNWEHVDFSNRRATLVPFADYNASRSMIKESLGLIDMSPNTGKSPHDRTRRAIGSYTICLTNEQECFKERYTNYADFSFRFERENIKAKVTDVLNNPKHYIELGIEIADTYRNGQDPDVTARYMLETASIVRLQRSPRFPDLQNYFVWPPGKIE